MEPIIRKLRIYNLKEQIGVRRQQVLDYAKLFEATSTFEERTALEVGWAQIMEQITSLRQELEFLEKQEWAAIRQIPRRSSDPGRVI